MTASCSGSAVAGTSASAKGVAAAGVSFACTLGLGMGEPEKDPLMLSRFGMNQISLRDPEVAELYLLNCLQGSASIYIAARNAFRGTRGGRSG